MRKFRKSALIFLLALVGLYIGWMSIQLIQFKDYKALSETPSSLEITGAYHIHSTLSDGKKNVLKIAKSAARASLDFCILTDHGNPNYESLNSQGWKKGILMLAGSELSVNRGHLVALGFHTSEQRFPQQAESAAYQVNKLNGFSIIAHPYSKTHWTWGPNADYSGLEIINADAMFKKNYIHMLAYSPALLIRPGLPLLKMLERPHTHLKKWDQLNKRNTTYGYYSTDAHMFYKPLFSLLRVHVILKEELSSTFEKAKNQVFDALRNGRFFNSIDAAAPAIGFRFWGESKGNQIQMGESSRFTESMTLHIKTPDSLKCQMVLLYDGKRIYTDSKTLTSFHPPYPGIYRVEVYLQEKSPLDHNCPWILSNPIFLRE
ncbi:MAG: hypothetical protein GF421_06280 [Candidatus Aminicenantes bacterium]|nr:hypothetical protein [Candidatus Aminicenantes bacterium]